ncbi:MAG TPA: type II secretion system inner membrane protein GspF [Desulfohalobiaceae bacterium]|nr:type II secretion system inner membrane protein GspF [Desulfohalobiaceae bacterium]
MPVYKYNALNTKGKEQKGIINADSDKHALDKLRQQSLYPRHLQLIGTQPLERNLKQYLSGYFQRVSQSELVLTIRQISTLLSAGMPLTTCLDSILQQIKRGSLQQIMAQIRERIHEGQSFAESMEEHPHIFPATFTAMIRAGENSGTLEIIMERLAEFGEQQENLKRKLQSSLAYPILILLVSLGVIFFLMSYVVPKVTQIFLDFDQVLPLPTIILIKLSNIIQNYWWAFPVLFLIILIFLKKWTDTYKGKKILHQQLLHLPLVGTILHNIIISRFSYTLGTLLQNDVSLIQSLSIVRNVVSNTQLQEAVNHIINEIREGNDLAKALQDHKIFPATMIQMVSAGEQSGTLETMFLKVAQTSQDYVTNKLTMLTSLLEPIMILILGGVVGFIVLAVLLPIFDMSHLIQ